MRNVLIPLICCICGVHSVFAGDTTLKPQFALPDSYRSVGIMHMSGWDRITKENPAGLYTEGTTAPPGSDAWQDQYIARALPQLRAMNAQAVCFWDIEGNALGEKAAYVGQPEIATQINPSFHYGRFARKWRELHYEIGVCVRADQKIVDGTPQSVPTDEQYERVRKSISYARKEWKVKWVYIDSNVRDKPLVVPNAWVYGGLTPSTMLARLHKEFPDVQLIPEHKDASAYLWSIPYHEFGGGRGITGDGLIDVPPMLPNFVARDIPTAVGFINCSYSSADELRAAKPALRAAIKRGCVLGMDAWWSNDTNAAFSEIYHWENP